MRVERLELSGFGPFEDAVFDFGPEPDGVKAGFIDPQSRAELAAHKREVARLVKREDIDWAAFLVRRARLMAYGDEMSTAVALAEFDVLEAVDAKLRSDAAAEEELIRFTRHVAPAFWEAKRRAATNAARPLAARHDKRTLAAWFHDSVREKGEPRNCVYCDGRLGETSPATIDHFLPRAAFPELTLAWDNLFPACAACNSVKRDRYGCLLRADIDPVDELLRVDEAGRLRPAPLLDLHLRRRVRLTLLVLGLNTPERCSSRRCVARDVANAWSAGDRAQVARYCDQGPHRIVARAVRRALDRRA